MNGVDLSNASHEKAATTIKNSPDVIDILAVHKPEGIFLKYCANTALYSSYFVIVYTGFIE